MPKVSVIIPTHNRPELLLRALASVYDQTFKDFEVIVVDDGDSPRAEVALANYLERINFQYLETKKNAGGSATRNMGIAQATGKYIAFLDDDDEWVSNKLATQIPYFDREGERLGFVFSAINRIHQDHIYVSPVDENVRDYKQISLIRLNGFLTSSLIVPKSVFNQIGVFDETLPSHQEADLILRIAQKFEGVGIREPLINMYTFGVGDHIGGSVHRRIQGREMLLKKHEEIFSNHPKVLARHYFWLALQYREAGEYKKYYRLCLLSLKHQFTFLVLKHCLLAMIISIRSSVKIRLKKD